MDNKRYFIRVKDVLLEVTEGVYREHYRAIERWRYIKQCEKHKKISLDQAIQDGLQVEKHMVLEPYRIEDDVENKILTEQMFKALELLNEEEKDIIRQLFFDGLSAREVARRTGVYHRTVIYRKDRVLEKLRKFMHA